MFNATRCLVIGYTCGNVLTADFVSRKMAHTSIFSLGTKNPGTANITHELGPFAGALTLTGDITKVIVAAGAAHASCPDLPWQTSTLLAGLGATLGHNYPIWHSFKGGKGVATTCATIILATPIAGSISSLLGAAMVGTSHSLGLGAITIPSVYLLAIHKQRSPALTGCAAALLCLMLAAHLPVHIWNED